MCFAEGDGVGWGVDLLLELDAFGDGVVHAFLHEAAVIVLHVVHVVRRRRRLRLLRGAHGEGKDCEAGAEERDWRDSQIA